MERQTIQLHCRLYRARCIDQALALSREQWGQTVSRRREGDYHVVEAQGEDLEELLAQLREIANAALVLTVDYESG